METIPIVGISVWLIVKIFFVIGILVYDVFALVLVKQIRIMTETLEVGFETPLRLLGYLHLAFALAVLVFALTVL